MIEALVEAFQTVLQNPAAFWSTVVAHLRISAIAVAIAILIAVPLGVISVYVRWLSIPVMLLANLGRIVPSLAVLAICLPFFGVGDTTALIALVALAVLPILVNVRIGILEVSPAAIDAARGIGLRSRQIFTRVQLPLALPVFVSGLRTAAVYVISSATLAAFIGAGGLGDPILQGVALMDDSMLLVGAIPVTIIAIATDQLLARLERATTPRGIRTT
ncbi:ABC transporter permease [Leucobacter weissii]|uniref:ABC transporter permease n=1 Tax=Leucobacter weissii TaxID=1983706 RepID=A0A939MHX7_9MICO|nr:ABC transporter permease [Leucobacter weissii]MBO1900345.1 ABC transporter permease [Leucobacter weissii]